MIEVKENVFWDETAQRQSDEAMQWLREDIMPRMACSRTETDLVQPVYDAYNRPVEWLIATDTCDVQILRIYTTESSSWAMDRDDVVVTPKLDNNGN